MTSAARLAAVVAVAVVAIVAADDARESGRSKPPYGHQIETLLSTNPLLQKMNMFKDLFSRRRPELRRKEESPLDDNLSPSSVNNNFDDEYQRWNATLFEQVDVNADADSAKEIAFKLTVAIGLDSRMGQFEHMRETSRTPTFFDDTDFTRLNVDDVRPTTEKPFSAEENLFETTINSVDHLLTSPKITTTVAPPTDVTTPAQLTTAPEPEEVEQFFGDVEDRTIDITARNTFEASTAMPKPVFGLSKSLFRGSTFHPMHTTAGGVTSPPTRSIATVDDENDVVQFGGHYSVSGTKYYVDNRVDSEGVERAAAADVDGTVNHSSDPFLVEAEMKTMRVNAAKTFEPSAVEKQPYVRVSQNGGDDDYGPPLRSTSRMEIRNGTRIEHRETVFAGKTTTVELRNELLHGHDLIAFPGAVVNGDMVVDRHVRKKKKKAFASKTQPNATTGVFPTEPVRTTSTSTTTRKTLRKRKPKRRKSKKKTSDGATKDTQIMSASARVASSPILADNDVNLPLSSSIEKSCFASRRNTAAASAAPLLTRDGFNKLLCLRLCADTEECTFATFSEPLALCALYSVSLDDVDVQTSVGHSLHRPLTNAKKCVEAFIERTLQRGGAAEDVQDVDDVDSFTDNLRLVEQNSKMSPPVFTSMARCEETSQVLFVKSENVQMANNATPSEMLDVSEDDCVFACLTNTAPNDKRIGCVGAHFDIRRSKCVFWTGAVDVADDDDSGEDTRFVNVYEKICVPHMAARQCSGGTPTRLRQKVLLGFLRDAHTVASATDCISLCIMAPEQLLFKCLSALFYPQEPTLNCILNDASALTNPLAVADESVVPVDYFGIDDCFGIREVSQDVGRVRQLSRVDELARALHRDAVFVQKIR